VEADRSAAAVEAGYSTLVTKLYPLSASDKNDVLVGLPPSAFGTRAMGHFVRVAARLQAAPALPPAVKPPVQPTAISAEAAEAANRVWGEDGYHMGAAAERNCAFFIKRKRRPCCNRAADGLDVCSLHTPAALHAERAKEQTRRQLESAAQSAAKQPRLDSEAGVGKHRISATQNRMRNPFARNPEASADSLFRFPEWRHVFPGRSSSRRVFLDVGSARGVFVEAMAVHFPERNYLGVEIRGELAAEAMMGRKGDGGGADNNVHHMEGNVLEPGWLAALLASLHAAGYVVAVVAVQFPDPWTAAKHTRRRTVSAEVAEALVALPVGALVYVSSDVPAVTAAAAESLATQPALRRFRGGSRPPEDGDTRMLTADADGLLSASPFGGGVVFTEREHVCEKLWRRVFRVLFERRPDTPL
jgi:tRNA G46 methylase TrmB